MSLLITGNFDPKYNRVSILQKGLQSQSHVFECVQLTERNAQQVRKAMDLHSNILLPNFTHLDVPKVRRMTNKRIIFDPLISRYLTKVHDFKQVWRFSPRALKNFLKDKRAFNAADIIIADTEAHKAYFKKTFSIPEEKLRVLYIGAQTDLFYPAQAAHHNEKIVVGFYGGFIPLQGCKKIIEAISILKDRRDIHFELVGTGFEWAACKKLAKQLDIRNLTFCGWIDHALLAEKIRSFDFCLGIFGDTPKAKLVIPNKIYHYAACQKAFITMETDAIKELFTHEKNCILTKNDPSAIAEAIVALAENQKHRNKLATHAHQLIENAYSHQHIGKQLIAILNDHQ